MATIARRALKDQEPVGARGQGDRAAVERNVGDAVELARRSDPVNHQLLVARTGHREQRSVVREWNRSARCKPVETRSTSRNVQAPGGLRRVPVAFANPDAADNQ